MPQLLWNGPLYYGAYSDEKAFFTWLESIKGVMRIEGVGSNLIIHMRSKRVSDNTLRDLIAIYTRYNGDLRQLKAFLTPENRKWFKNPQAYWYAAVFHPPRNSRALTITLKEDEALVLSTILESKKVALAVEAPERNALQVLETLLEQKLCPTFSPEYKKLLKAARKSLVDRYGA